MNRFPFDLTPEDLDAYVQGKASASINVLVYLGLLFSSEVRSAVSDLEMLAEGRRSDGFPPISDAELTRHWEEFLATVKSDRGDCPSPEQIWEAVAGGLTPEKCRAMVEHTAACESCAFAWAAAKELQAPVTGGPQ